MPPKPPAKPSNQSPANSRSKPRPSPEVLARPQAQTPTEVVDPRWLIQALGLTILAAIFCAWLALCLLVYQGEWQLVLHPSHTIDLTPARVNLPFEQIRFDAGATGQPRLTGWWIPAESTASMSISSLRPPSIAKYRGYTILYLHDGAGSLSASLFMLTRLHAAGINVFAIDYRGFGASDSSAHPTEARMAEDSAAALDYLTSLRHIAAQTIVPYGVGLGASLAANLAREHPVLPAVILDNPVPDPTAVALAAQPSHVIPVRFLFHERFDIAKPLSTLNTPKLLIAGGNNSNAPGEVRALQALYRKAASPSLAVTLPPTNYDDAYQAALSRFFDEYLPAAR
jgi:pimeloyl-ACP methyl ester carboxylesterase